ncbi:hypothetical protein BT69DRAFT_1213814 [Atractiella rhizophila]|nr:hypothetical protein BT69DRAFT_1213814 [Atractiella rhizophila]
MSTSSSSASSPIPNLLSHSIPGLSTPPSPKVPTSSASRLVTSDEKISLSDDEEDLEALSFREAKLHSPYGPAEEDEGAEDEAFIPKSARQTRPGLRSLTRTSFDYFRLNAIPLSLSRDGPEGTTEGKSEKTIGFVGGVALVVGSQIGAGIFSSPGIVTADAGSVGVALLIWICSGLLAWTGASSFAELGTAIPLSGGAQTYLNYSYGPLFAFLYAFTAIWVMKPVSAAIISVVFGEYVCRILFVAPLPTMQVSAELSVLDSASIPSLAIKGVAFLAILLIALLNMFSTKAGTSAQVVLTVIKVSSLLSVIVMGLLQLLPPFKENQSSALKTDLFANSSTSPSSYALAFFAGLWSYDGWDTLNFLCSEVKNIERDLNRIVTVSLVLVGTFYVACNISYFIVLEKETVELTNTVALDFGHKLYGPTGGLIFAIIVAVSCFGALNGNLFSSSRLIYVAGQENFIPRIFGKLNSRRNTPVNAIFLQALLTMVMVAVGEFKSLVNFFSVTAWTFYFLTVTSLLYLRIREPHLPRPHKTWIITPIIFSCVSLFLVWLPIFSAPMEAASAFGFILLGIPVYYAPKLKDGPFSPFIFLYQNLMEWNSDFWMAGESQSPATEGGGTAATDDRGWGRRRRNDNVSSLESVNTLLGGWW